MTKQENFLKAVETSLKTCDSLLKIPSFAKLGKDALFTVLIHAHSLDIDPVTALSGGLFYARGKVEMSARLMNALIRSRGHQVLMDERSNEKVCILHGKRADSGDTLTQSFSLEEAKSAGIYRAGTPWTAYPKDMLFARALSRLARQLFPDVIGNFYVQGEISELPRGAVALDEEEEESVELEEQKLERLELTEILEKLPEQKRKVSDFMEKKGIKDLYAMPEALYSKILAQAKAELEKEQAKSETVETESEVLGEEI